MHEKLTGFYKKASLVYSTLSKDFSRLSKYFCPGNEQLETPVKDPKQNLFSRTADPDAVRNIQTRIDVRLIPASTECFVVLLFHFRAGLFYY